MPITRIILDGDGAWPDLKDCSPERLFTTDQAEVACLDGGMESGRPSIAMRFNLPDGKVLIYQTSVGQFQQVAAALRGKYGDLT
jgi:hypothetical protein